jgi:hypothetical protein
MAEEAWRASAAGSGPNPSEVPTAPHVRAAESPPREVTKRTMAPRAPASGMGIPYWVLAVFAALVAVAIAVGFYVGRTAR